ARCKRGSRRRDIAKRRLARTMATAARIRHHWLHCQTTALARHYSLIVIEDLKVRNMTASAAGTIKEPGRNVRQKAGLNRVILEQGWR
ncbi:transposase, partial [Acinetobacter baumannii]